MPWEPYICGRGITFDITIAFSKKENGVNNLSLVFGYARFGLFGNGETQLFFKRRHVKLARWWMNLKVEYRAGYVPKKRLIFALLEAGLSPLEMV